MNRRRNLREEVEASEPADLLLEATLPTPAAHRDGDTRRIERLMAEHPGASAANVWVASATGNLDAVRTFLANDPTLARRDGGTRNWDPLLYLCFSRLLRTDENCAERMLEIARLLLDAGADPNSSWIDPAEAEGNRETPLYGAAGVANRPGLARLLVERGADPNDGETAYHMVEHDGVPCAEFIVPKLVPLHRGIALGHKVDYDDYAGLERLLELGADPNGPSPFGNKPLHQAVFRGRERRFFELLLEHGADVNLRNGEGRSAYAMARRAGRADAAAWLVAAGADTTLSPIDAFVAACAAGDRDAARELLRAEPGLRERFTPRDRSEICEAAAAGNRRGLATMLELGWDVNTRGLIWGETPAHRAAMDGHLAAVRLLVERGADLTVTDRSYHSTPLGWAQHGKQDDVVDYLRTLPERLDLWDAMELGLEERALALLSGVDPDAAMRGAPAGVLLRLAASKGSRRLVEELLRRGGDPTLPTPWDSTAISVAREFGHPELAELMERGG
jgi:ankyrin repeat protein